MQPFGVLPLASISVGVGQVRLAGQGVTASSYRQSEHPCAKCSWYFMVTLACFIPRTFLSLILFFLRNNVSLLQ